MLEDDRRAPKVTVRQPTHPHPETAYQPDSHRHAQNMAVYQSREAEMFGADGTVFMPPIGSLCGELGTTRTLPDS